MLVSELMSIVHSSRCQHTPHYRLPHATESSNDYYEKSSLYFHPSVAGLFKARVIQTRGKQIWPPCSHVVLFYDI